MTEDERGEIIETKIERDRERKKGNKIAHKQNLYEILNF